MRRLWLVPYHEGWSYDLTAKALERYLSDRFDVRIIYRSSEFNSLRPSGNDLILDFWWGGGHYRRFGKSVAKQVSSHRWAGRRHGLLSINRLANNYLNRNGLVVVPSQRLFNSLRHTVTAPIAICPKGFHPELMGDHGGRRGELVVGWAGNAKAPDKNVAMLVSADPGMRVADQCLTQGEMDDFYNSIDVITCASDAEGDPRPLIEGMACGCFPVTVDVGIVPELVSHGVNGLIVERTQQAFADAFSWCRENIDQVRSAGRRNAIEMKKARTWRQMSEAWAQALLRMQP